MPKSLTVDLFNIPSKLSHRILGSASDYIITSQCLRTLVRFDEAGQLEGDAAESWEISPDKKTYIFKIKSGLKFSNGEIITPEDIAASLNHPDFKKIAIHFDFSIIESIRANGNQVIVVLKEKNTQFLLHLTQPEFGVFHKTDRGTSAPTLKVSSGPYYMEMATADQVDLKKNTFRTEPTPSAVKFVALKGSKFKALEQGAVDMALLWEDPSTEVMNQFMTSGKFDVMRPHVGFTFWVTLNPNSKELKDQKLRTSFQLRLKKNFDQKFKATASWEHANQLFLPGGPGRISSEWATQYWKNALPTVSPRKIVLEGLVTDGFHFSADLLAALDHTSKDLNIDFRLTKYTDQTDFMNKLRSRTWDFYLINNDFSSYELVKNLVVTFNKEKPLIQFPQSDQKWNDLWKKTQSSELDEERYKNVETIAKNLMDQALIVPLVYKSIPIIKRKEIDLSLWSTLFPEFAFWKVRIKDGSANP